MSQYIGKTISLISNKGLRYVGLLDNINADDATVALKSVRLFGTEGRMAQSGNPNLEVPPGTDVYDYVVFRGSDVKDLTVMDDPIDKVQPSYPAPPQSGYYQTQGQPQTSHAPPTQTRPVEAATTSAPAATSSQGVQAAPSNAPRGPPAPTGASQQERPEPTKTTTESPSSTQRQAQSLPGSTPEFRESRPRASAARPPQPQPQARPNQKVDVPDTAFDFESANAKFSRDQETERDTEHTSYNKQSSFFDTISSSTEERNSMRWSDEKNLNIDTFGEASIQTDGARGRGRGRGRGGWRGGRGNWRGGRGGNGGRGGRGNSRNDDYNTKPEWA